MLRSIGLLLTTAVGCWLWRSDLLPTHVIEDAQDQWQQILPPTLRVNKPQQKQQQQQQKQQKLPIVRLLPLWKDIANPENYTYDNYLFDIPEKLVASEKEYNLRKAIFDKNWELIRTHNNNQIGNGGMQTHHSLLGLNDFLDRFDYELPQPGYDKTQNKQWQRNPIDASILAVSDATASAAMSAPPSHEFDYWYTIENQLTPSHLTTLPKTVDWRIDAATGKPLATPVKAQGHCGSCWAFASAAAIESHVALASHNQTLLELSMQELVSCVPNPNHCGGSGGCHGSTAELALDFVAHHGLVDEWHFGYQSYHDGDNKNHSGFHPHVKCSLKTTADPAGRISSNDNDNLSKFYEDAVATVKGYIKLPSNNYTALMHSVAKFGPVIVNVASDTWRFYESGVYTPQGHSTGQTDINHVVALMGYGTDETTGEDYWLVRNSWGPQWGEEGYIRLKRVDPQSLPQPDADCGMDVRPAHGIACTEKYDGQGHRHHITPPAVKVCGTSGILFDPVLPYGARLVHAK